MQTNFHTHTIYCDGKDTPRQLADYAVKHGFSALGFSSHIDPDCGMTPAGEQAYRREIRALEQEYAGRLELFCGVEQDITQGRADPFYDYAIGSVHYLPVDGTLGCIDWSREKTLELIQLDFDGDPLACARAYYAQVGQVLAVTGAQIVGHFDLLTKFDEQNAVFDQASPIYRQAVLEALESLAPYDPIFEINTGAMAKGYRTSPYPAFWILQELHRQGFPIIIGSDCHAQAQLAFGFAQAADLARWAGYRTQLCLGKQGWIEQPLICPGASEFL